MVLMILATVVPLQMISLEKLDYTRARVELIGLQDALRPPLPLHLGPLRWDAPQDGLGPSTSPLSGFVRASCTAPAPPLTLAACLTSALASRCPHGPTVLAILDPATEYPSTVSGHLAGQPCDGTTRSSILAAALLRAGVPARLVHMTNPSAGITHTAIEVLDRKRGWQLFDPLFAGTVTASAGGSAAAVITASPEEIRFQQLADTPAGVGVDLDGQRFYLGAPGKPRATHLVYPEPWLYTRSGQPTAPWPFVARYVVAGPPSWSLGIGQHVLCILLPLTFVGLAVTFVWDLRVRRSTRQAATAETANPQHLRPAAG
jgi:hypothetical protein